MRSCAFAGRQACLTTMHGKEQAIGPVFGDRLELSVILAGGIDTDQFGAFSGEIERPGTMEEVLEAKARAGMRQTGLSIGIASEGSYGAHPDIPFLTAGLEKLVLIDAEAGLTVVEHLWDETPVSHAWTARTLTDISQHLPAIRFPEQALLVRPEDPVDLSGLRKGIDERLDLETAIEESAARSRSGRAIVETEMRAHLNPRRMSIIARLAEKLAERLLRPCPACHAPGWGQVRSERGLPCEWCGGPSVLVKSLIWGCSRCGHEETRPRPDGLEAARPGDCAGCNP